MNCDGKAPTIGVLMSGGLDSGILLGQLLDRGEHVQPFYIRSQLHWEPAERQAAVAFLRTMAGPRLAPLVTLEMPLADVYTGHWSLSGREVPGADTDDAAVFLPGRNALLVVKAALWCQLRGIGRLALAPLRSNPFEDATGEFFEALEAVLNRSAPQSIRIERPFVHLGKSQVMRLGRRYRLDLTFSCIDPVEMLHCGVCNKCAERRAAFQAARIVDPTAYADAALSRT